MHYVLIKANLFDGTVLYGLKVAETDSLLTLYDFITGSRLLMRSQIRSSEITTLEGSVLIECVNGSTYYGSIRQFRDGSLQVHSESLGIIAIQTHTIQKITPANAYLAQKSGAWFSNPNATRYLFAPSAIPLKKGEGYYQNAYLLANSVSFGVNDYFTVGGGVVIPLLFYVTPKVSFKVRNNLYLGAGVLFTQSFISDLGLSAGIGYGLVTVGNQEHNLTLGSGYGFARFDTDYRTTPLPITTLNGMTRVAKNMCIITENWFIPRAGYYEDRFDPVKGYTESVYVNKNYYAYAFSLGGRFMPGVKTSIDFSMVAIKTDMNTNTIVLPYLDFVYKFE